MARTLYDTNVTATIKSPSQSTSSTNNNYSLPNLFSQNFKFANLISDTNFVQVPFVKVTIGQYTFGVYQRNKISGKNMYTVTFPNYIQGLTVKKINGQVNKYSLVLRYPITETSDPNFFEKVFSSVGIGGRIVFSYGDYNAPNYAYRDEEAIITKVNTSFQAQSSIIEYTVTAIGTAGLLESARYSFDGRVAKPSDIIKELITNGSYRIVDSLPGMQNVGQAVLSDLIPGDDKEVKIEAKNNYSIFAYINYLVSLMQPIDGSNSIYVLGIYDDNNEDLINGSYLKISKINGNMTGINNPTGTYSLDIGYPSVNVVTNFQIENNENWSVYYKYNTQLATSEYVQRINDNGELENVYSPVLYSDTTYNEATASTENWWKRVTEYPISASITLRGLLRHSILMSYIKLNVYYYGRKHISSGLYVITSETTTVDLRGYETTLTLRKVGSEGVDL